MPYANTPYNFVPMPDRVLEGDAPPLADRYYADRHTGWFDISLTTLTPFYTRGASGVKNFSDPVTVDGQGQSADFFHYGDDQRTPVVPGSSMRGMIRSLFEILTYSRMEFVSNRQLFFRSFAESRGNLRYLYTERFDKQQLRAGILVEENGTLKLRVSRKSVKGFILLRAADLREDCTRRRRDEFPSPRPVFVQIGSDLHGMLQAEIGQLAKDGDEGFLIVPGADVPKRGGVQRSWFQVVLNPAGTEYEDFDVPQKVYDDYLAWGSMAHGKRFGESGSARRAPRKIEVGAPAFALVNSSTQKVEAIGANMMMHLRYDHSISEVAEASLSASARNVDVDMAQSVFGRVHDGKRGKNTDIIRGRVFFEDAKCGETGSQALFDPVNPIKVPNVLSGPKPTAFQLYLEQKDDRNLANWDDRSARIAGRKVYWHRSAEAAGTELQPQLPNNINLSQFTKIAPLRTGVHFTGRIRFENLTSAELGALYASIQLPNGLAHKLGMGKNLGLGSVRVEITTTCLMDMQARFASMAVDAGHRPPEVTQQLLRDSYAAFVQRVLPKSNTLWSGQRMLTLAALLSWTGKPNDNDTAHVGFDDQWKYRWTLPEPQRLASAREVGDALPSPLSKKEGSPPTDGADSEGAERTNVPLTVVPTTYEVDDLVIVEVLEKNFQQGTVHVIGRYLEGRQKPVSVKKGPKVRNVPIGEAEVNTRIRMKVTRTHQGDILKLAKA